MENIRHTLAFLIVILAACTTTPAPVATIAPITPISPTPTPTLAPGQMHISDYLAKAFAQNHIQLLEMHSSPTERIVEVYIAPTDDRQTQAAAEVALGILVKTMSLVSDPKTRAQTLTILYDDDATGKLRRMTMTEPTISSFIEGRITEDEAVRQIKIEEAK